MTRRSKPSAPTQPQRSPAVEPTDVHVVPRDLGRLFTDRPLISGESEFDYDLLLSKVTAAVAPSDAIEEMWVRDITDLAWDMERGKRLKASRLMVARKKALDRLIAETHGPHVQSAEPLRAAYTNAWLQGEPVAVEVFNRLLAQRGLNLNSLMALALSECLNDIERYDRMITTAEARRNRILLDIERRREAAARRQRLQAEEVPALPSYHAGLNQR